MSKLLLLFVSLTLALLLSCDGGIHPKEEDLSSKPRVSGKVTFIGEWPSDVKLTYIILFKDPLMNASDFNALNLKYVSEPIPIGAMEFNFSSDDALFGEIIPGNYSYFVVAQSTSETLQLTRSSWRVAGIYKDGDGLPEGNISVPSNSTLNNVSIVCDFNNPPQQPPGE